MQALQVKASHTMQVNDTASSAGKNITGVMQVKGNAGLQVKAIS